MRKIYKALFRCFALRKGIEWWGGGGRNFGAFFSKKVPFLAFWPTLNAALDFSNMPWPGAFPEKVTPDINFIDEAVVQCYVPVVKILL